MPKDVAAEIATAARQFVADRDNYAKRFKDGASGLFATDATHMGFSRLLDQHAEHLASILPTLNLVELEGLSELCYTLLNNRRAAMERK